MIIDFRTQNNIKNRFFSTLKNLFRKLLKKFLEKPKEKKLQYISSRDITDLYEGRGSKPIFNQEFKKFQGILKKILKEIDFEIEIKTIVPIIEKYSETLHELTIVFIEGEAPESSEREEAKQLHFLKQEQQIYETKSHQKQSRSSEPENEIEQTVPICGTNQWTYYAQPVYYGFDQNTFSMVPVCQPNYQPMFMADVAMQNNPYSMLFPTQSP